MKHTVLDPTNGTKNDATPPRTHTAHWSLPLLVYVNSSIQNSRCGSDSWSPFERLLCILIYGMRRTNDLNRPPCRTILQNSLENWDAGERKFAETIFLTTQRDNSKWTSAKFIFGILVLLGPFHATYECSSTSAKSGNYLTSLSADILYESFHTDHR